MILIIENGIFYKTPYRWFGCRTNF